MLQRRYRLRLSSDLQSVRQNGRSWRHPLIVLLVKANQNDVSRFAFVAGRRIGKAVVRNRCRRLMREVVRHHLNEIEAGWDMMLIARSPVTAVSYHDVETAVLQLLSRANLLCTQRTSA
ncbi:MAG: ribonuclease P protein component [Ardenticatenaceae bacterium]|nr:ribonuclease P protein component [Ardenticatenaceae bacterium]MCB9444748.1 ribonuclease P protein component [Ardenticatenaceae bacterium]